MNQRQLTQWKLQSSRNIQSDGKALTTIGIASEDWYDAVVPSTVLGALAKNGHYENLYKDKNLETVEKDQFSVPWWYYCDFDLNDQDVSNVITLNFEGINYKGNVWLNGAKIADNDTIYGAYRHFEVLTEGYIHVGRNLLAVEVVPPVAGDFSIGFVDWNPKPPDRNMGIFRGVSLNIHNNVSIKYPCVTSKLDLDDFTEARLSVSCVLKNHSSFSANGILTGCIDSIKFSKKFDLEPYREKTFVFSPEDTKELIIQSPRIWEPNNIGDPNLYELELELELDKEIVDQKRISFGIREVSDYLTEEGHRGYIINGRKLLIKGAGWTDDLLLGDTVESIETQIRYARDMNLNCIRLEGFWGKDETIYDLCDRYGMLLMVGWSCHWEHECHLEAPVDPLYGGVSTPESIDLIAESWEDQLLWLRHHPSIFVWTVASDIVPHPDLELKYRDIFKKWDTSRPYLNSTGGVGSEQSIITDAVIESTISGSSGVKMLGPYDHTPPYYWYTNRNLGGAYGFNTETSPGANVPPLESLKKMFSTETLWPINDNWDFHCGLYEFSKINRFKEALDHRYGLSNGIDEFAGKSQVMNYELMRPMFEAFQCNKGAATGIIQWMLNSAFPSLYWQLFDSFLMPNGAYYAVKKACEPLHLLYNYGDKSIYLINDFEVAHEVLITVRVMDFESKNIFSKDLNIKAGADSSTAIMPLPENMNTGSIYFLNLCLSDFDGNEIGSNFYWLPLNSDLLDYDAVVGDFGFYTPSKVFADFTELSSLPSVELKSEIAITEEPSGKKYSVTISNDNNQIAFFVHLNLVDAITAESIIPVFWSDNYISLLPHEQKTITAKVRKSVIDQRNIEVKIEGWNKK